MSTPSQSTKSDRHTCEAAVWARGYFRTYACGKTAKVERDGKWYCGIHDPVRLAEKRAARDAEYDRRYAENRKHQQLRDAAPELYEALRIARKLIGLITVRQVIEAGDDAIAAVGLNPWCMNEGRATGDEPVSADFIEAALAKAEGKAVDGGHQDLVRPRHE